MIQLPAIRELCRWTSGHSAVRVAIVDGPIDLADPELAGARLTQKSIASRNDRGLSGQHGTQVARLILGQASGIAPRCSAVSLPIFESANGDLRPCSQLDLAQALTAAIQEDVHVINISGGQFTPSGAAHPLLAEVVCECERRRILIVAAAGNEGCDCLHVPAAMEAVLAVGATDEQGEPLAFSNWGAAYRRHGIVAPGDGGTSFAAARVSGVAALLLSLQLQRGLRTHPLAVRDALRRSALDCDWKPASDCRRLLLGRLNISGAMNLLFEGKLTMSTVAEPVIDAAASAIADSAVDVRSVSTEPEIGVTPLAAMPAAVTPSACSCAGAGSGALVYALGQLGYDLVNEARLDSLAQKMAGAAGGTVPQRVMAFDPRRLLDYLAANPWDSAAVTWTLNLDGTPIYAIRPSGAYAADAFKQLAQFLREQLDEGVERVSIPGTMAGQARLFMGQSVPVIEPDLRGMYSWTTKALVESAVGAAPAAEAPAAEHEAHQRKSQGVRNFLDRVYHGLRNLGQLPQDRALNFAATNAFEIESVYESAIKDEMDLDSIQVTRSPICRPGSDCWDVELYFFFPARQVQTVRKVYRFTVDVSDVVPVTVGTMRSWFAR